MILHAGGFALLVVVRVHIIKFQLRILVPRSKYEFFPTSAGML